MRGTIVVSSLVVGCTLLWFALGRFTGQAEARAPTTIEVTPPPREAKADSIDQAHSRLMMSISLKDGFARNTTFKEALDKIGLLSGLTFLIDTESLKGDLQIPEPENMPVELPKFKEIRVDTVLRHLMTQISGVYTVRPAYIEITSRASVDSVQSSWKKNRTWFPVNKSFKARPLNDALREVSDHTGISIVLDARRVGARAQALVTAVSTNAQIDTVVMLLANQAKLKSIRLDNILFVTTEENAKKLQQEYHEFLNTGGYYDPADRSY